MLLFLCCSICSVRVQFFSLVFPLRRGPRHDAGAAVCVCFLVVVFVVFNFTRLRIAGDGSGVYLFFSCSVRILAYLSFERIKTKGAVCKVSMLCLVLFCFLVVVFVLDCILVHMLRKKTRAKSGGMLS